MWSIKARESSLVGIIGTSLRIIVSLFECLPRTAETAALRILLVGFSFIYPNKQKKLMYECTECIQVSIKLFLTTPKKAIGIGVIAGFHHQRFVEVWPQQAQDQLPKSISQGFMISSNDKRENLG